MNEYALWVVVAVVVAVVVFSAIVAASYGQAG